MMNIQNVVLIGKYRNYDLSSFIQKIANHLIALNCNVSMDKSTVENTGLNYPIAIPTEKQDLAIVIGGDGSMLSASRAWGVNGTPLIGVNYGRVGFLTDLAKDDVFEKLSEIIKGQFKQEKRSVLKVSAYSGKEKLYEGIAVNDFVVGCATARKLVEFSLFIDEEFVYNQYADGIIVATATGSSAYALASGGSLVHPSSEVLNIVPVCPQSLSNRPLIISSSAKIKILLSGKDQIYCSLDGIEPPALPAGAHFLVEKNSHSITLYHPNDYSYFEGLRNKLNWG
jgi:NAD+ kinase